MCRVVGRNKMKSFFSLKFLQKLKDFGKVLQFLSNALEAKGKANLRCFWWVFTTYYKSLQPNWDNIDIILYYILLHGNYIWLSYFILLQVCYAILLYYIELLTAARLSYNIVYYYIILYNIYYINQFIVLLFYIILNY